MSVTDRLFAVSIEEQIASVEREIRMASTPTRAGLSSGV